jgi:hypothetical protein
VFQDEKASNIKAYSKKSRLPSTLKHGNIDLCFGNVELLHDE